MRTELTTMLQLFCPGKCRPGCRLLGWPASGLDHPGGPKVTDFGPAALNPDEPLMKSIQVFSPFDHPLKLTSPIARTIFHPG